MPKQKASPPSTKIENRTESSLPEFVKRKRVERMFLLIMLDLLEVMPSLRKCGRLLESFTLQGCLSETESVDKVMCSVGFIQQSLGPE